MRAPVIVGTLLLLAACDRAGSPRAAPPPPTAEAQVEARAALEEAAEARLQAMVPDCPSVFRFDPESRLSLDEASTLPDEWMGDPPVAAKGGVLVYRPFDYEDSPTQGRWTALGVIYARPAVADGRTVGGVLWAPTSGYSDGGGTLVRTADGATLTVRLPTEDHPKCESRFVVTLGDDGAVTAGGKLLGRL